MLRPPLIYKFNLESIQQTIERSLVNYKALTTSNNLLTIVYFWNMVLGKGYISHGYYASAKIDVESGVLEIWNSKKTLHEFANWWECEGQIKIKSLVIASISLASQSPGILEQSVFIDQVEATV